MFLFLFQKIRGVGVTYFSNSVVAIFKLLFLLYNIDGHPDSMTTILLWLLHHLPANFSKACPCTVCVYFSIQRQVKVFIARKKYVNQYKCVTIVSCWWVGNTMHKNARYQLNGNKRQEKKITLLLSEFETACCSRL